MNSPKSHQPLLAAAALALAGTLLAAAPAAAQHELKAEKLLPNVPIELAVLQPGTFEELGRLSPGDTLTIDEGQTVVIHPFQLADNNRWWHAGTFRIAAGGSYISLEPTGRPSGETAVRGIAPTGNRAAVIVYEVLDSNRRPMAGSANEIRVEVRRTAAAGAPTDVDRLVQDLYQGILLRDPDADGARWATEKITADGWNGLVETARTIADSRESQIQVYERADTCNQQRLMALYRNLLGAEAGDIDLGTWRRHLDQLDSGDVGDAVAELMQSREFRTRYGLRLTPALISGR
jgi:hypothetical protein